MKTSRIKRIFLTLFDTFILLLLRPFRKFTALFQYEPSVPTPDIPTPTASTRPETLGIEAELSFNGEPLSSYTREEPIFFDPESPYTDLDGIVTFRGNHKREGGTLHTAPLTEKQMEVKWSIDTGRLKKGYGKGFWTGSGWTGQPLIVRWPEKLKQEMCLFDAKKQKQGLTEVVYSTMDGNVYFIDLEDGSQTRTPITVGLPFKGSGALDPRGIPLLYLGPGDSGPNEEDYARALVYSLVDHSRVYEYGGKDPFSLRTFCGYDSSALVDANTDTLIQPGENGILYTTKLNTKYENGKLSISPDAPLKLRYTSTHTREQGYWLGMEDSAVIWKNYIYIADNGGSLLCIDLNTMEIIWAQDVEDDTNGSPVLSVEDGIPYLYIATSLHFKASKCLKLYDVPIFKINALTGEYVWRRTYLCNTVAGVSGGIQATAALGKGNVEDLVFFPVARTPLVRTGLLVALNKKTGDEVWRYPLKHYAWSSPVLVYDEAQNATLIQGDSKGTLHMIDAKTGRLLRTLELGANIEATPAVFEDTLVVGTRGQKIFGISLK